ncbi:MAG: hypothetical protein NZ958_03110, partial [Bacteroidia bacterium]|nr:hypothetical protein [Bacteroidia bacterium]
QPSLLLLTTYGLLLLTLGFQLYVDAAIPPWALRLKCPTCYQKDALLQEIPLQRYGALWLYLPWIGHW